MALRRVLFVVAVAAMMSWHLACTGAGRPGNGSPSLLDHAASAQSPAQTQRTVQELIAKLPGDNQRQREQATASLIDLGQPALPAVRAALAGQGLDPKARLALRHVLEALDPTESLLAGRFTQLGWAGGTANDDDPHRQSFFRILQVRRTETAVAVRFDWKNGVQNLNADGLVLRGMWTQDNGWGDMELTFDGKGHFLSGRWRNSSDGAHWYEAFLR